MFLPDRKGEVYFHIIQNPDCTLRYHDNRKVEVGKVLKASKRAHIKAGYGYEYDYEFYKKPTMCQFGMHASKNIWDAMKYVAPEVGRYVCLVRLHDKVEHGYDKSVALRRECITMRQVEVGKGFDLFLRDAVDAIQRVYGPPHDRTKLVETNPHSHVAHRIKTIEYDINKVVARWILNDIDSDSLRNRLKEIRP